MIKGKGLLLFLLSCLQAALLLAACSNDSEYTAALPTIPDNAQTLFLAKNASAVSSRGYVRFSHATHNARPEVNNDCMICHIHTAVTVSPSWPCAKCHGPGGIAAGAEVCSNPETSYHGQSCITRACFDCHTDRGVDPNDCHYCHAYTATFADSTVEGAVYQTAEWTGKTTSYDGYFDYFYGDTVTFSVGGLVLGSVTADASTPYFITPVDLVPGAVDETNQTVTNIARFLLTIDLDITDGRINIPDDISAVVAGRSVDFSADTTSFENDPVMVDIALHYQPLVTEAFARSHLAETILNGPWFN